MDGRAYCSNNNWFYCFDDSHKLGRTVIKRWRSSNANLCLYTNIDTQPWFYAYLDTYPDVDSWSYQHLIPNRYHDIDFYAEEYSNIDSCAYQNSIVDEYYQINTNFPINSRFYANQDSDLDAQPYTDTTTSSYYQHYLSAKWRSG